MAMKIILEWEGKKQVEIPLDPSEYDEKDWEKVCDEIGNNVSKELAMRWLGIVAGNHRRETFPFSSQGTESGRLSYAEKSNSFW